MNTIRPIHLGVDAIPFTEKKRRCSECGKKLTGYNKSNQCLSHYTDFKEGALEKKLLTLLLLVCTLSGCAGVATKYKWDAEVDNGIWGLGKWIPNERYTCKGASCEAEFETGGKIKGGKVVDLSGLQLKNQ